MLKVGDPAPEFSTVDANGEKYSLADFRGSFVVLYFYPEDETPGCTIEACSFRDNYSEFPKHHAVVFGVSIDTPESHRSFAAHHNIPFPLLIDTDKKIVNEYEAYGEKNLYGHISVGVMRKTYIIDPQGKIAFIWKRATPLGHAEAVLAKLEFLELGYNIV